MGLIDINGAPLKPPAKADLVEETGGPTMGGVRQIQSGHPADGLTPYRLGALLREAETGDATAYLELAEQMEEKDLHYAAVLGVRKRAIRRLQIVVEAGAEDDGSERAAELVRATMNSAAIMDDLVDMLDALGKGYSATEIMWNVTTKPWTISRLEHRDPRWFRFDQVDGRTPLLRDEDGDLPLPAYRYVFHCARLKSGLPIRSGLARLAAWAYVFKNYTLKDWAVFMEAYGHPLRIGKHGNTATAEERAKLLNAVRRLGVDMAAIMPKSMEVEIVNGNVTGADKMFEGSARYWDEQLSKAILGQVSTTDAIAGGHAVGKVHNLVREDIRDADAMQLASTLARDLALPLTVLNFGDAATPPRIRFEAEEERDPRMTLLAIKTFGPMGLKISEKQVRDLYGLREPEEGETILSFPARDTGATPDVPPDNRIAAMKVHTAQGEIAALADRLIDSGTAQDGMDMLLGGLLDAIDSAGSLEDIRDILATAADGAPDETLRDLLAKLSLNARLAGEVGAELD
ncbi:hypothetical protein BOO69_09640 [Sulfitobacter alexandrii]|uniref:DUF935 domain-containing protein n=1 Tax=Sulfitobacter alexandrii TaxID=1917485 RepID=A0A1J0WH54_9RHOB|nr:DUF935 domain-containing protein [Sulfitobacter alexandrii]APE43647.1 hypothetical protein BOO69_09640 [Sulfitobacter alexandrii]